MVPTFLMILTSGVALELTDGSISISESGSVNTHSDVATSSHPDMCVVEMTLKEFWAFSGIPAPNQNLSLIPPNYPLRIRYLPNAEDVYFGNVFFGGADIGGYYMVKLRNQGEGDTIELRTHRDNKFYCSIQIT